MDPVLPAVRHEEFPLTPAMLPSMQQARARRRSFQGCLAVLAALFAIAFLASPVVPLIVRLVPAVLCVGLIAIPYLLGLRSARPIDPGGTYLRVTGPARIVGVERSYGDDGGTYTVEYLEIGERRYLMPPQDTAIVRQAIAYWPVLTAEVARLPGKQPRTNDHSAHRLEVTVEVAQDPEILFELRDAWGNILYRLAGYAPDDARDGKSTSVPAT